MNSPDTRKRLLESVLQNAREVKAAGLKSKYGPRPEVPASPEAPAEAPEAPAEEHEPSADELQALLQSMGE
jgi:hypothetical protein